MSNALSLLAGGLLAAVIALPVSAQDESAVSADTVVATVNGKEITVGHMILMRARLPEQYQQLPPDVLYTGMLNQIIEQTLLAESFEGETPSFVALSLDNEERGMLAAQVMENIVQETLTADAIRAAYEAAYADSEGGTEFNASHILVETEEEALAIRKELEDGADFATLARDRSTGPSGPNGGNLGWFGEGMMVKPFEDAVVGLDEGAISDPIQTQFGWHIVTLNEKRISEAPPLEDVRNEIADELRSKAIEDRIQSLRDAAEISETTADEIDPAVIADTSLVED